MAKQLIISDLSADFDQFVNDFQTYLARKESWKGNLTTTTGQTIIELLASIGAFNQAKINRAFQDCFAETAVSDAAIRACAVMQGIRMTRKSPAQMRVSLTAPKGTVIMPYTQFTCAGYQFFNREQIPFLEGTSPITKEVILYEGEVHTSNIMGNGENLQVWISDEDNFQVSDFDVSVSINGESIPVSYAGLWNYKNAPACTDRTTSTGRCIIQFGSFSDKTVVDNPDLVDSELVTDVYFGSVPSINDKIIITYCTTEGLSGNNYVTLDSPVTIDGINSVEGTALENPRFGSDQKDVLTYKNNTASSFGTYGSAVTKAQYSAIVNSYPGVIDTVTQAQREINPGDLRYMNVIWVTGVTDAPWDENKKRDFCEWCQKQSMYSTRFVWIDAIAVNRRVRIKVYCYNSAILAEVENNVRQAITKLFAPRPGILKTNFYRSDIIQCALNSDSNISYVVLEEPTKDCIVTRPDAPSLEFKINTTGGNFIEQQYAYCVTLVNEDGVESLKNNWVHPIVSVPGSSVTLTWYQDPNAEKFRIYGRLNSDMGLLAEVDKNTLTYTDNGSVMPDTSEFGGYALQETKYNALSVLNDLSVTAFYAERQQRLSNALPSRSLED